MCTHAHVSVYIRNRFTVGAQLALTLLIYSHVAVHFTVSVWFSTGTEGAKYCMQVLASHFQLFLLGLVFGGFTVGIIVGIMVGIIIWGIWRDNGSGKEEDYKACHLISNIAGEGSKQKNILLDRLSRTFHRPTDLQACLYFV